MSVDAPDQFQIYQQRRQHLLKALDEQVVLLERLNMLTAAGNMRNLAERTATDNFKVMVVGEFNRGKSTLINAFLGKKVLPAYAVPTTAIINEVKWGDEPKAFLYHLPPDNGGQQRIEQIPVDDLEKYVVAAAGDGEQGKPFEKVVLEWPLDLCRDGVELVDAPGLNADLAHQRITLDYLTRADAVVFVIACDFPMSKSESETVAVIKGTLHYEDIFFVCTRLDRVDDDQELVKKRLLQLLTPLSREGARHVYFVNALGALQAKITQNPTQLQASGVPDAERDLKNFLATERGRIKLVRPAYDLQDSVQQARQGIREAEKLAQQSVQELQRRYDEAQQPLMQLSSQLQDIKLQINAFRGNLRNDIGDRARAFFLDLANQPKGWTVGFNPENAIGVHLLSHERREALADETVKLLSGKANARYEEWQTSTLLPTVEAEMRDRLLPAIKRRVETFDAGLADVKVGLTGVDLRTSVAVGEQQVPLWQRVVGGVGGLLLGDVFSAGFGVAFGIKPMLVNAGILLGVATASVILTGGLSLAIIVPAMIGASAFQLFLRGATATEQVVAKVAEEFSAYIKNDRDKLVANVVNAVDEQVQLVQEKVEQILTADLNSVRERVEGVLAEKLRGQQSAEERQQHLRQVDAALDAQFRFVVDLMKEYAMTV